jgi:2-oxo-4-hydroxy-4-carboxy-5-ureidoimidazoline decarboxylase
VDGPLAWLNALPVEDAERELLACCASPAWAAVVLAGRPYRDRAEVLAASERVLGGLAWGDVEQALAGHPRIGERAAGDGRAAAWSRGEQAGTASASEQTRAALAAGNAEYERRFGHVYLVCATGRDATELLALLHSRLGNDPQTERQVVRAELGKITRLRLENLL